MWEKTIMLTFNTISMLTLLAVNDQIQNRHIGYVEILYDPIFYIILVSGIGVAVFADAKDPNLEFVASLRAFGYSFLSSVLLSTIVVAVKVELQVGWLMFYGLIAVSTTISPTIVRRLMIVLPDVFTEGIGGIFASFFRWGANKYSNEPIKKEEDDINV